MSLLRLHLGLVLLFLYAPLLALVALSFDPLAPFSRYDALWRNPAVQQAAIHSAIVAVAATVIATFLGTLIAVGLHNRRRAPILGALSLAPLLLSDVVQGVALLSLYAALGFSLGLHSIVLSHVVFTLAFVAAVVRRRLRHFDWRIIEASEDLGAGGLTTFARITLPLILPGVLAAALLALALSLGDFVLAAITAGEEVQTLPMLAYAMIKRGTEPEVTALGTLLLLASFVLVLAAERLSRPRSA
ncbi:MAG TPA: ABC transporter permease subunit [Kiloniellales bacterium]|nr:ABC transporter permease subunit [Kiloniellales bacterium]